MAYYYSIPIEEMEEELESLRFYPVNLVFRNKPVKEWVYERKLPRSENHFVRVYTGINRYGQSAGESRKSGKDAIRIQVIYRDAKGETLVSQTKRVHRVGGWRKNLHKRMNEVSSELPQVEFDSRGEPMTLRKKGKNQFWGSRDYPKFKETKPFASEEIRCCKECDKTTGLTTIQAGTYCYDCLPINLGAESDNWDDIDWETDEPPKKEGWEEEINWDAEMEWNPPIHDINSMEELIDIYESRERYDNGKLKPYRKAWTHMNLFGSHLFRINFSGVYSCRVIANSSKIMYGNNMLDDLKKGWNTQMPQSNLFYKLKRVVSAETPYIPQNKEANLDELITNLKNKKGWAAAGGSHGPPNVLVFDMEGIVFAIDYNAQWSGNLPKTSNWRQLRLDREPLKIKGVLQNGEIEIYGGVPKENVIYETTPSEPYNYADVVKTKNIADLWDAEPPINGNRYRESGLKEFDDTTADDFVKDSDDKIILMLRKKSKINKYGDIGCPVCGSIGLFSGEIIAKGKKWYCFECLYEDKTETIKSRGDITLEKYGLVVTCPVCKNGIKAYNQDSMLRHIKKCGVSE
jgi:hypothetical protein